MKRENEDRREMKRRTPLDRLCCMSGLLLSIACGVALIHVEFRIQEQQRLLTQTTTVCDKMENEILRKVQQTYKHWGETRDESWQGNTGRFSWVYALTFSKTATFVSINDIAFSSHSILHKTQQTYE